MWYIRSYIYTADYLGKVNNWVLGKIYLFVNFMIYTDVLDNLASKFSSSITISYNIVLCLHMVKNPDRIRLNEI